MYLDKFTIVALKRGQKPWFPLDFSIDGRKHQPVYLRKDNLGRFYVSTIKNNKNEIMLPIMKVHCTQLENIAKKVVKSYEDKNGVKPKNIGDSMIIAFCDSDELMFYNVGFCILN